MYFFVLFSGNERKKLKHIIDITIGYPDEHPLGIQEVGFNLLPPRDVKVLCRVYPMTSVPTDSAGLQQWLFARWQEKDQMLDTFYKTGNFAQKPVVLSNGDVIENSHTKQYPSPRLLQYSWLQIFAYHVFWLILLFVEFQILSAIFFSAFALI